MGGGKEGGRERGKEGKEEERKEGGKKQVSYKHLKFGSKESGWYP